MFHLEDIVEETGYVLEQDSEYSQKFVEEEDEVSISIAQKGGKTIQHQVRQKSTFLFSAEEFHQSKINAASPFAYYLS